MIFYLKSKCERTHPTEDLKNEFRIKIKSEEFKNAEEKTEQMLIFLNDIAETRDLTCKFELDTTFYMEGNSIKADTGVRAYFHKKKY